MTTCYNHRTIIVGEPPRWRTPTPLVKNRSWTTCVVVDRRETRTPKEYAKIISDNGIIGTDAAKLPSHSAGTYTTCELSHHDAVSIDRQRKG